MGTDRWIDVTRDGYLDAMSKSTETETTQADEFTPSPGSSPTVTIEASKGTLRYRTSEGTDTGKSLVATPGQSVWLEGDAKGNAEATVTTTWPIEGGEEVRTITEPGLIHG